MILRWLLKGAVQEKQATSDPPPTVSDEKKINDINASKNKSKELVVSSDHYTKTRSKSKKREIIDLDCRNLNRYIAALFRKGNSRACFYRTLHQRRVNPNCTSTEFVYHMKMKKEDIIRGLASIGHHKSISSSPSVDLSPSQQGQGAAHNAGNKVLPISDNSASSSSRITSPKEDGNQMESSEEKSKQDRKAKALSRMKELVRWAAAAKAEKGGKLSRKVMQFRNKGRLKTLSGDGGNAQHSLESPKISFRWDVESTSTITSAISAVSMPTYLMSSDRSDHCPNQRKGNWITTDSDFVVLEL